MDCSRDLLHYKSYLWIFPSRKIEVVSEMKEHDHGEDFLNASDMDVCNELNMQWI
jgi:hypothetical protein